MHEKRFSEDDEMHGHEVSSWHHRFVSAQAEKEDMQARCDREVAMLHSQRETLLRTLKAEKAGHETELELLKTRVADADKMRLDLENQLDEAKREVFRLLNTSYYEFTQQKSLPDLNESLLLGKLHTLNVAYKAARNY